eukprot:2725217-Rhodomonas_salina.1
MAPRAQTVSRTVAASSAARPAPHCPATDQHMPDKRPRQHKYTTVSTCANYDTNHQDAHATQRHLGVRCMVSGEED